MRPHFNKMIHFIMTHNLAIPTIMFDDVDGEGKEEKNRKGHNIHLGLKISLSVQVNTIHYSYFHSKKKTAKATRAAK